MPTSRRIGVVGFAKQAAKGTAIANPVYTVGKSGGGMKPVYDIDDLPLTGDSAARRGRYKQRARGEGTFTILASPDLLGLLLYEACGSQTHAGEAAPYTKTFPIVDNIPQANPMTVWDMVGNDWWRFTDSYVSRLRLAGTSGENTVVEVTLVSLDAEAVDAPTYTLIDEEPRHKFIGGTTKLEADSDTPVTMDTVESVELVIDRALELRYGASLTPSHVIPDRNIDFSAGLLFDDSGNNQGWDFVRQSALGTTGTGAVSQDMASGGSFEVRFGRHPEDATRYLQIESTEDNWEYVAERPEADPAGGPIEFDVAGPVNRPAAGGSEVVITLLNDVAAEY